MKRQIALLHAKTKLFRGRLDHAKRIINQAWERCPSWYVALSGGKDSTVVLNLLPNSASVLNFDDEWLLPETEQYLQRITAKYGPRFHRVKSADQHADFFMSWPDDPEALRGLAEINQFIAAQGWQGCFLGLRETENSIRHIHLRSKGQLFYNRSRQVWQCNPIAKWTWQDVWAYIYSNDLDYNRAYDVLDKIGVPPERQRIGPLAQRRALGYGQMAILKRGWPDLFNEFAARFPETRSYT